MAAVPPLVVQCHACQGEIVIPVTTRLVPHDPERHAPRTVNVEVRVDTQDAVAKHLDEHHA
jgi:hypothetical protein